MKNKYLALILFSFHLLVSCSDKAIKRRIIDVHFHARGHKDYGVSPPNPVTGVIPKANNDNEVIEIMLATLRQNNIVKAVCSGSLNKTNGYIKADKERIIPSYQFPDHERNALPDTLTFIKFIEEGRIKVFGELGYQYIGQLLTDKQFQPLLKICERYAIPVAIHTGISAPGTPYRLPNFRTNLGRPLLIEETLIKYPKLKIQLMHMGYPFLDETLAIMHVYPQVYVDIAVINWFVPKNEFYRYLKTLIDAGFEKRIMYGSDQMAWEDAIPLSIRNVEDAPFLTDKQKDDIFYNNASYFFKLSD